MLILFFNTRKKFSTLLRIKFSSESNSASNPTNFTYMTLLISVYYSFSLYVYVILSVPAEKSFSHFPYKCMVVWSYQKSSLAKEEFNSPCYIDLCVDVERDSTVVVSCWGWGWGWASIIILSLRKISRSDSDDYSFIMVLQIIIKWWNTMK